MTAVKLNKNQEGMIFETAVGSSKDGPGLRYVIYFKGCNLNCPWCSNPEGIRKEEELLLFPKKEQFTKSIVNSCPYKAIKLNSKGFSTTNRVICKKCNTFDCVDVCYDNSRIKAGEIIKVEEIVSDVLKYEDFFRKKGGVTLSGGEPTFQWGFMFELIKSLNQHKIHIALETNGTHPELENFFSYVDLVICDLKMMDSEKHIYRTGFSNKQILKNIEKMYQSKIKFWIRIPIVPGINDSEENLRRTKEFLVPMRDFLKLELLAYHQTGVQKWKGLGGKFLLPQIKPPSDNKMQKLRKYFSDAGITVINT